MFPFPHPKPWAHQWLSWCLRRAGPGKLLFLGLALNLMNISSYCLAQDELLFFSTAAVTEYTGQGKGRETLAVQLLPCHSALAVPLPLYAWAAICLPGQTVLRLAGRWTASGLGGSSGVAHFSFHLLPLQRAGPLLCSHLLPTWVFSVRLFQIIVFFAP